MAMRSGERNSHTLFSNQELQLWEQTACNKHLNQSLWEFCYWLWSKQVWGLYYGSCDSVCGFLMAKISHGQLETKDFIFGLKKKGMKKNSILLCSLAFILKGISLKKIVQLVWRVLCLGKKKVQKLPRMIDLKAACRSKDNTARQSNIHFMGFCLFCNNSGKHSLIKI